MRRFIEWVLRYRTYYVAMVWCCGGHVTRKGIHQQIKRVSLWRKPKHLTFSFTLPEDGYDFILKSNATDLDSFKVNGYEALAVSPVPFAYLSDYPLALHGVLRAGSIITLKVLP